MMALSTVNFNSTPQQPQCFEVRFSKLRHPDYANQRQCRYDVRCRETHMLYQRSILLPKQATVEKVYHNILIQEQMYKRNSGADDNNNPQPPASPTMQEYPIEKFHISAQEYYQQIKDKTLDECLMQNLHSVYLPDIYLNQ